MTFLELQTELDNRIAAAKVSGFWSSAMKKQWINTSGERAANYFRWKKLEYALKTVTKANQEYYDYPDEFQEGSIYFMKVNGEEHIEAEWDDYQEYKEEESTDKIFASHDSFYFVNPTPTLADLEIEIHGIRKWVKLVENADTPITPSEMDDAIIKLSLAICLQKERRYSEAAAELTEVEAPRDPRVPGSGGILARLSEREEDEGPKGYIGRAKSTRWM